MKIKFAVSALIIWPSISFAEQFLYLPTKVSYRISCDFCCYRYESTNNCHGAFDFSTPNDTEIIAAASGRVERVYREHPDGPNRRGGYGNYVELDHPNGYTTIYAHLRRDSISVDAGDQVNAGQLIALSDSSGRVSGPHLHFEVRDPSGRRVDPYGENPEYPNCGPNSLWVTCPPTPYTEPPPVDADADGFSLPEDCDDANPEVNPAASELCNYIDDNCDGAVDEGYPGLLLPCVVGIGACENAGVFVCTIDFAGTACSVLPRLASEESCDGIDNDCDGVIDNVISAELCGNGIDDDCDGEIDEEFGSTIQLTDSSGYSELPHLALADSGFGLTWGDWRDGSGEIYFMKLDLTGMSATGETALTSAAFDAIHPFIASDGTDYTVFWRQYDGRDSEVAMARVDELGMEVGDSEKYLTSADNCSEWPHAAWNGLEYGVTWHDCRGGGSAIYFAAVDELGNKITPDTLVYDFTWSQNPSIASNSTGFGLAWECEVGGNWEICFAEVDASGEPVSDVIQESFSDAASAYPAVVWVGDRFAIAWQDTRHGVLNAEVYAIFVNEMGFPLGEELRVTDALGYGTFPAVAWSGSVLGIVWRDDRDGDGEIYFCALERDGLMGPERQITNNSVTDAYPAIAPDGSGFRLVWSQSVGGANLELMTTAILCVD